MKAKIYYRRPDPTLPHNKWKYTVKTIEVSKNEPNHITGIHKDYKTSTIYLCYSYQVRPL